MSAIAGIVHFDGAPLDAGLVGKMTEAMASRGPDGISHVIRGPVGFGQCMLRTTPESLEEVQPAVNEDAGLVLVMDGRVDNRDELRRTLLGRGIALRNRSDAELVLRAYETWGEDCPDRIIGEFVFFIWDARRRRLFGARDAAGTRHFYFHGGNGWFCFASEIKGLLALGRIENRLNESRLLDYLAVEFDRDDEVGTFYHGISRLPAGHAMLVTERGARTWRYWNPGDLAANRFASLDECAEAYLEQLRVAVKCRLRSTGPVGAMLSGGLDSSSIVGLIRKEFRAELGRPLKTFSMVREDRENCADWQGIQEMLKDGWIDATIIDSGIARSVCSAYLGGLADSNEPFSYSGGIFDSCVYESARAAGCRVVLDGMAGDLLFYDHDRSMDVIVGRRMYGKVPAILAAYRRHNIGRGLRPLVRRILAEGLPEWLRAACQNLSDRRELMAGSKEMPGDNLRRMHPGLARRFLAEKKARRRHAAARVRLEDDQGTHARNFTSGLLSFGHEVNGQMALSRGVEPRSPFSDRRMIEFAIRMPVEAKLFAGWYKHVARKSMLGILPERVRWRRTMGKHPGWKFHEQLIGEIARTAPDVWNFPHHASILNRWIDPSRLANARAMHDRSADYGTGFNLFTLTVLAQWLLARNLDPNHG